MSEVTYRNKKPSESKNKDPSLLVKLLGLKKEAFAHLDEALKNDSSSSSATKGNAAQSKPVKFLYEKSLNLIDQGLKYFEKNKKDLESDDDAEETYSQLNKMKDEASKRLTVLEMNENDMSKLSLNDGAKSKLKPDFLIVDNDSNESMLDNNQLTDATELLHVDDGVQMFYIKNDGVVSMSAQPATISIYSFNKDSNNFSKNIVAFIKIGSWLYPLIPNESPVMKTNYGAYILPNNDENQSKDGSFLGISFSDDFDDDDEKFFEDILGSYGVLIHQTGKNMVQEKQPMVSEEEKPRFYESVNLNQKPQEKINETKTEFVSRKIIDGAQLIGRGVEKTAQYADKTLKNYAEQQKQKIEPRKSPINVPQTFQSTLKTVRRGTGVPVKVSSYVVKKLGSIAASATRTVVEKTKIGAKEPGAKAGVASNAFHLTGSSIHGFGIVYDSLEQAAKSLAASLKNETCQVVDYKYGPGVANCAKEGIQSAANIGLTVYNVKNFRVGKTLGKVGKTMAVAATKETFKTVKDNHQQSK